MPDPAAVMLATFPSKITGSFDLTLEYTPYLRMTKPACPSEKLTTVPVRI
jgi:hypothetical protein